MQTLDGAKRLAKEYLADLGDRWAHVQAVGHLAEGLLDDDLVNEEVVCAAWLHDVGYSSAVDVTGFHPLDGARFLARGGWPEDVVGLVAHHTGASDEASERNLRSEFETLPVPTPEQLDEITLIDLSVAPDGSLTTPRERIREILGRYSEGDPVHAAVTHSGERLLVSAERARKRLGLPDDWPLVRSKRVGDTDAHRGMEI